MTNLYKNNLLLFVQLPLSPDWLFPSSLPPTPSYSSFISLLCTEKVFDIYCFKKSGLFVLLQGPAMSQNNISSEMTMEEKLIYDVLLEKLLFLRK